MFTTPHETASFSSADAATAPALSYATPRPKPVTVAGTPSMIAGLVLVAIGAVVLLVGTVVLAEYAGQLRGDLGEIFLAALCVFSGICLFAGLPLVYRGTRKRVE